MDVCSLRTSVCPQMTKASEAKEDGMLHLQLVADWPAALQNDSKEQRLGFGPVLLAKHHSPKHPSIHWGPST